MIRLFTAIALPEDVRARLATIGGGIRSARWVTPERMHLTLRFIGEVDDGLLEDLCAALSQVSGEGFDMTLDGVGLFGERRRNRTLWVGVVPDPALMRLQAKIEAALVRTGLEPESRKFKPHITVARLREAPMARVREFLTFHHLFRTGPFPVREFHLYSSRLSQNGPLYRIEDTYPLVGDQTPNLASVESTRPT